MKKLLATILTVVLVVSLLPLAAGAAFSNGDMTLLYGDEVAAEGTHYTYDGTTLTLLQSGGSYTLSGTAAGQLRVLASATNITLTLRAATFTGPENPASFHPYGYTGAVEFLRGGTLRFADTCAVTGGDGGNNGSSAVFSQGTLTINVGDADVTLTSGSGGAGSTRALWATGGSDLNITISAGRLHCETRDSKGSTSLAGISGGNATITYTDNRGRIETVGVGWAKGLEVTTLTVLGEGVLDIQGCLDAHSDINLGDAHVTVVNVNDSAIVMQNGGTLRGSGLLAATGGRADKLVLFGLQADGDLTLSFTGDLELTGGSGGSYASDSIGNALGVDGTLTVAAAPRSLKLTPGVWNGTYYDNNWKPIDPPADFKGFSAVWVSGAVTPFGDVPITNETVNKLGEIRWTRPNDDGDGGEWVTVSPATGGDTKANPHTGR